MPIIDDKPPAAPVFFPKTDYKIAKYIDLLRLLSILQRRALFFCRLDRLEDKFEGTSAKLNYELRRQWYLDNSTTPLTEAEVTEKVLVHYEFEQKKKALNCVCCWNKYDGESAALWKIYSDFNRGIMITSSIDGLKAAFADCPKAIQLTEVEYIDYTKELMPDGNSNYPILHKHIAYKYEQEVRLIHAVSGNDE
jgi:hypothetical protein